MAAAVKSLHPVTAAPEIGANPILCVVVFDGVGPAEGDAAAAVVLQRFVDAAEDDLGDADDQFQSFEDAEEKAVDGCRCCC